LKWPAFSRPFLFECAIPGSLTWSDQGSLLSRNEAADQLPRLMARPSERF
jgi:hypothetical protein